MKEILKKRLKEPSTWAGLSVLAVLFGVPAATADAISGVATAVIGMADTGLTADALTHALGAVAALGAVFLPEKPTK
jgi:hypothetical protein